MKKIAILFFANLIFISFSFGQLQGGLKGGLNVGDVMVTNQVNYFGEASFGPRVSYHFGSYVQNNMGKYFDWRIELLFSNKGYVFETDSIKTNISLNYLNWPLLIVYNAGKKVDIEFGVELGYMITGDDLYKNFDMGVALGVRYDINRKINAGVRYTQGLPFEMTISSPDFTGEVPRYQLSTFQFSIGYNLIYESPAPPAE